MKTNLRPQKEWSRIKTYEKCEKVRFFSIIEKKKASDKIWTQIKCKDGTYSSSINVISNRQTPFYTTLFTTEGLNQEEPKCK